MLDVVPAHAHVRANRERAGSRQQTLNFTLGYFTPLGCGCARRRRRADREQHVPAVRLRRLQRRIGRRRMAVPARHVSSKAASASAIRVAPSPASISTSSIPTGPRSIRICGCASCPSRSPCARSRSVQRSPVQPYFGAGLGIINWRYSESGEFVDFGAGNEIFRETFVKTGTNAGPVVLGGIRFAGDTASAGFEIKYQKATRRSGRQLRGAEDRSRRLDLQLHGRHSVLMLFQGGPSGPPSASDRVCTDTPPPSHTLVMPRVKS